MKKITFCLLILLFSICQVNEVFAGRETNITENSINTYTNILFPGYYVNFQLCTDNNNPTFTGNLPNNINKQATSSNHFLVGTVNQSAANAGFDDIYKMEKEYTYTVISDIDGEPDVTNHVTVHIEKHHRFRIDDYSDVPSYTNYRGVIKADDTNYVNGWLFKNVAWSVSGAGTINIPADTDVFEVVTLNNAALDPGVYCIITELDSDALQAPLEITVYEANGNNYGTQIGWTNAFTPIKYKHQTVFFKINTAKKVFVRVNSTQSNLERKYKIKCVLSKPILLVHGIRSGPRESGDDSNFEELDIVLKEMGYIVDFLYYDSGDNQDKIYKIIKRYKDKIEKLHTDSLNQNVIIIAHSFGATLTDLCLHENPLLKNEIQQVITIGGVHRGSPFANLWCDFFASNWKTLADTTMEIKNAMEIGGAGCKICSDYQYNGPGVPLIALNGKWGTAALTYYNDKKIWKIPRHYNYQKLDEGMVTNSDGMVPNFSACPNDVAAANQRRLVYTSTSQGMAHDSIDGKVYTEQTESHIVFYGLGNSPHGFFIALTNILAGGNIQNTDGNQTETVPQNIGAVCKKYNVSFYRHNVYASRNGNSTKLWKQDIDDPLLGQQEEPYYILIGDAGNYSVDKITYYNQVRDAYDRIRYVFVTLTTNLGTISVTGGQAKFDN